MYQNQGVDLASMFLAADQSRQNEIQRQRSQLQLNEEQRMADLQPQLQKAREMAANGDDSLLIQIAPQEAQAQRKLAQESAFKTRELDIKKQGADTDAAKAGAEKFNTFVTRAKTESNIVTNAVRQVQANPGNWPAVRNGLIQMHARGLIQGFDPNHTSPDEAPSPEALDGIANEYASANQSLNNPEYTGAFKEAAESLGYAGRYDEAAHDPKVAELVRKMAEGKAKGSAVNVSLGGINLGGINTAPLTTATETKEQDKLISTRETLDALKDIKSYGDPTQFLTGFAKAGNFALSKLDKYANGTLTPEQEADLGKATTFRQSIDQLFNAYKKLVTGTGGGVKEMEDIKNSMLNSDLSPAEFKASLDKMVAKTEKAEKISSNILNRGIEYGSDSYRKEYDRLSRDGVPSDAAGAVADRSLGQQQVVDGKGKKAHVVTKPFTGSVADVRSAAEHLADQNNLQGADRQAFVAGYVQKHGGGK